jgi:hypothetical protein
LFAYRKFGPGFGVGPTVLRENRRLASRVAKLSGPKLRLHSSLVAPVIAERREDIEWMEARLGVSLAEDLAAHDEGAIRSEEDLLRFSPETLQWLAEQLGGDYVQRWRPRMGPREVADWMHQLRMQLATADDQQLDASDGMPVAHRPSSQRFVRDDVGTTVEELVQMARRSAPGLKSLGDEDAEALVREVFRQIRQEIDSTPEGKIAVGGLGLFRARQGKRERNGRVVPVKRVSFRSGKPGESAE